jgi:hypothetical protein
MGPNTLEYVLAFTMAHEGDTSFMYNNWPLKNPNRDVTAGVGRAITDENMAASDEIRSMFTVKATGQGASPEDMRAEFRRVYDLPRTANNLWSDYRDKSPLQMDRDAMLGSLRETLLGFWDSKGQSFPDFATIPAQAQVALMSFNYGIRLSGAPKMCNAVRASDYAEAAAQSFISTWDQQKNEAHKKLFMNAATIVHDGIDLKTLPPMAGPFKPPPTVSGGTSALGQLAGKWSVAIGDWKGLFFFDANGGVSWAESDYSQKHSGRWSVNGNNLEWKFQDPGDFRTFTLPLPLNATNASGTILPAGQGWFTMSKSAP